MSDRKAIPILIGTRSGDYVLIESHPKTIHGRFEAEIHVRCGVWMGHFTAVFVVGELRKFGSDLNSIFERLKCTAVLKPNEPRLQVTVNSNPRGRLLVEGFARQNMTDRVVLEFEFQMDVEELPKIASALMATDPA
jgi:hypothetical protein